ncbi:cytidine deaminase [Candidatus Micrarchaeota archaeon]|nr:cytidine deaminase [Candidatus Micrarchaeota archaeon]
MTDAQLIERAKAILKPRKIRHNMTIGDVGCALLSDSGTIYLGVCMEIVCGIGFCAEHSAIAAMVTAGEQKIKKIVAVSEYGIVPPCGRCREFISQIHEENMNTLVIIGKDKVVKLKELLPYCWDSK